MMKRLFYAAATAFLALAALTACDKVDEADGDLVLTGGTQREQTFYADETGSAGAIRFTAKAPWTATVEETRAGVEWLRLSAYNGEAGEVSLSLTLDPNQTGKDRKARIRIVCGETTVDITVEQKALKADGTDPGGEPEEKHTVLRIVEDSYYFNGTTTVHDGTDTFDFTYDDQKRVETIVMTEANDTSSGGTVKTVTTVTMTYGDKTCAYEAVSTDDGVEAFRLDGQIELDDAGRAVKGRYTDYEYKDQIEYYQTTYTLSYNAEGQLVKSVARSEGATEADEERMTWEDGNLTKVWWGANTMGQELVDRAVYGKIANSTNLDLNWFLVLDSEGFDFATCDTSKIFATLGYTGVRTRNLADRIYVWDGGSEEKKIEYEYTTDDDGTPLTISCIVDDDPTIAPYEQRKYRIIYAE